MCDLIVGKWILHIILFVLVLCQCISIEMISNQSNTEAHVFKLRKFLKEYLIEESALCMLINDRINTNKFFQTYPLETKGRKLTITV
jgi:hypothetical protein